MASRLQLDLDGSRMGEGSSDDENAFSCSIVTYNPSTFSACLQPLCALSVSVRGRLWLALRKSHVRGDFFSPVRLAILKSWCIVCVLPEESMGE